MITAHHHEEVPKVVAENLAFRKELWGRGRTSDTERSLIFKKCREDILYWINAFVWQYNPRKKDGTSVGPFITWDFQDEAVRVIVEHIFADRDLVIEKSREMGASWLNLLVMDGMSTFLPHQKFLCVSHSEDAVDRPGDPDSLFWKLNFVHEYAPSWMPKPQRRKLAFNYDNGSVITGASTSERSGVGGRATAVFLDEFSKQREDRDIWGQTADVGCRIVNATHYGLDTTFYQLTQDGDIDKLVMHWSQHPEKKPGLYNARLDERGRPDVLDKAYSFPPDFEFVLDGSPQGGPFAGLRSPWYDKEVKRRKNPRDVAQHLDINPTGSQSQFFSPFLVRELTLAHCREPVWKGDLLFDEDSAEPSGLSKNPSGRLHLWVQPDHRGRLPQARYAVGCDPATGTGATPTCFSILNLHTGEKVGEYRNPHMKPEEAAFWGVALCRWLLTEMDDPATFVWEVPGPGLTLGKKVMEIHFRQVYWKNNIFNIGKQKANQPGWWNNPDNQDALLRHYNNCLEARHFCNPSAHALKECLSFCYGPDGHVTHGLYYQDDPSGARQNHGDQAMADAMACLLLKPKKHIELPEEAEAKPGSLAWRRQLASNGRQQSAWLKSGQVL